MNIERRILNNISNVSLILGIIIIIFCICEAIDLKFTITTIGGIFAFWYGYKKYERDKELEIIEKYTNEYNEIKLEIQNEINSLGLNGKPNYYKLIDFFYKEYYLFERGYISNKLWNDWKYWIKLDISYIISFDLENTKKDISKKPYILDILSLYKVKQLRCKENTFLIFLIKILEDTKSDLEKGKINSDKHLEDFRLLKIDIIKHTLELIKK